MRARDWFVVGVRLFGVWMLTECLASVVAAIQVAAHWMTPPRTELVAYGFHAAVDLVVGGWLLMGAPNLSNWLDWSCTEPDDGRNAFPVIPISGSPSQPPERSPAHSPGESAR